MMDKDQVMRGISLFIFPLLIARSRRVRCDRISTGITWQPNHHHGTKKHQGKWRYALDAYLHFPSFWVHGSTYHLGHNPMSSNPLFYRPISATGIPIAPSSPSAPLWFPSTSNAELVKQTGVQRPSLMQLSPKAPLPNSKIPKSYQTIGLCITVP
jgi:hypothetical protein